MQMIRIEKGNYDKVARIEANSKPVMKKLLCQIKPNIV